METTMPCFANLSNHPVANWSDDQRQAAENLGHGPPTDLREKMPEVPASETTEDVGARARALGWEVTSLGATGAFVAGDFSLTVFLVALLQREGIHVYAATSQRDVVETRLPDGSSRKQQTFRFVQWREYPQVGLV